MALENNTYFDTIAKAPKTQMVIGEKIERNTHSITGYIQRNDATSIGSMPLAPEGFRVKRGKLFEELKDKYPGRNVSLFESMDRKDILMRVSVKDFYGEIRISKKDGQIVLTDELFQEFIGYYNGLVDKIDPKRADIGRYTETKLAQLKEETNDNSALG